MRINFNDLTAVYVGMSYLIHNVITSHSDIWKVLPLFERKDANMINGISIY